MRGIIVIAILLAAVLAEAVPETGTDGGQNGASGQGNEVVEVLERIEQSMADVTSLTTEFIQEKTLSLLDQKVVLRGTIYIQKPDLLAWHVTKPIRYSMVVRDDSIRQWDEDTDSVQKISLDRNPAFRAAMTQMRMWFTGAYTSMTEEYDVSLVDTTPTRLRFVPKADSFLHNLIASVAVTFREDETYLQRIEIFEENGDRTTLEFVNPRLNVPIVEEAWEVRPRR